MYPHVTQFETVERFAQNQLWLRAASRRRTPAIPWWGRLTGNVGPRRNATLPGSEHASQTAQ